MKHFFTLMALLLTSVTFGQETCNNVFDYNDNNTIDIEDFLAILGLFADVDLDNDGTWDSQDNCLDLSACNYASELNEPCTYLPPGDCDCNGNVLDECGVCGGTGLAPGTCDCGGTLIDVIGVCGGDCWVDEDADGICDDVDECVGEYDACDVCNGPGAIYECGCANIPEGECDCDGNVLDAIGVCGGACSADEDADGICDDVDDCVGEFDVCGVCNGPGEVYECGCGDVPEGECDCDGNVLDAIGVCGGACSADEDGDGVCDDVDDCVGEFDECGVCNGEGAVYDCGCNDIPEGECDCDGNVFDECGVCNGPGPTEIVIEDIVTYYDSVYLPFDDAWYVYPVDADTTFGFTCAPSIETCGVVNYQGYDYSTVRIGNQCWFAENLRSENYQNGDAISTTLDWVGWVTTTSGFTTVYGETDGCESYSPDFDACDETESFQAYGRLYNWFAVNDSRGLCPNGWHVPTDQEWAELTDFLGGASLAGETLASDCGWSSNVGTNDTGFEGLPGGFRSRGNGDFYDAGNLANWWSSTHAEQDDNTAWGEFAFSRMLGPSGLERQEDGSRQGYSIRCIQEILGCTDPSACNYIELANVNDGSCEYESCAPAFETCGDLVSYQGYEYATVQIGDQCWFAENLRSENYNNGDNLLADADVQEWQWAELTTGAVAIYGGSSAYCETLTSEGFGGCDASFSLSEYGRLYNGYAVVDSRGLCPSGWHVPSDSEWTNLTDYLGGDAIAGDELKETEGWSTWSEIENPNGNNSSGFTGRPGGIRNNCCYHDAGGSGSWWTSSIDGSNGLRRSLTGSGAHVSTASIGIENGLSIRCIQDAPEVFGCIDSSACNYDELANTDDGSCEYESCVPSIHPCGDPVSYQGYDYATVQIGEQCWFAENLRSENYLNGDDITAGLNDSGWSLNTTGAVAVYGEGNSECESYSPDGDACDEAWSLNEYGRLYNWWAVSDDRGLCPAGWHVSTDSDWTVVTEYLGGFEVAGGAMKTDYGWVVSDASNSSGFSCLPGGWKGESGNFRMAGESARFWTSSSHDSGPIGREMHFIWFKVSEVTSTDAEAGFAIRCIQDTEW